MSGVADITASLSILPGIRFGVKSSYPAAATDPSAKCRPNPFLNKALPGGQLLFETVSLSLLLPPS